MKWNPWSHPPWQQSNKSVYNTSSHTQPNKMMEDLLTDCQQRWIPSNLELLASLQSEDYIYLYVDWNHNSKISTTISWGNPKDYITGNQWIPKRERNMLLSTNRPFFKEISSTTTLRLLQNPTILNFQVKNNTTQVQRTKSTASTKRKLLPMNFMQSTKCLNPLHRWQQYRNSWPLKSANGNSFHHMDLTSDDYGKQKWNPWSIICEEH